MTSPRQLCLSPFNVALQYVCTSALPDESPASVVASTLADSVWQEKASRRAAVLMLLILILLVKLNSPSLIQFQNTR